MADLADQPAAVATPAAAVASDAATPAAVPTTATNDAAAADTTTGTATNDATAAAEPADGAAAAAGSSSSIAGDKLDDKALQKALKLDVLDKDKKRLSFGGLVGGDEATPRVVAVFVRHFFCGICQDYVRALMHALPPAKLAAMSPPTRLIIIGHGDQALISSYAKETGSEYAIYSDPTRKLFDELGFKVNLQHGKTRPAYLRQSILMNALASLKQNLLAGSKMLGGGKFSQNGGEMVLTRGRLGYFYRMRNTADHTEVENLEKILNL